MEIDVLYRIKKDLCWQYINTFVKEESVDLILYRSCLDIYTTKKTIWNAIGRISPGGIFCIQAIPENISDIIKIVSDKGYKYKVVYFDFTWTNDESIIIYLIVYKNEIYKPNIDTLLRISSMDELSNKIIGLSNFGDIVLCIGDSMLHFAVKAKVLSRNVIAFGDDSFYSNMIRSEGVREVIL